MREQALRISVDKVFWIGPSNSKPTPRFEEHNKVLWTGPRDFDNHGVRQPVYHDHTFMPATRDPGMLCRRFWKHQAIFTNFF